MKLKPAKALFSEDSAQAAVTPSLVPKKCSSIEKLINQSAMEKQHQLQQATTTAATTTATTARPQGQTRQQQQQQDYTKKAADMQRHQQQWSPRQEQQQLEGVDVTIDSWKEQMEDKMEANVGPDTWKQIQRLWDHYDDPNLSDVEHYHIMLQHLGYDKTLWILQELHDSMEDLKANTFRAGDDWAD